MGLREAARERLGAWQYVVALVLGVTGVLCAWQYATIPTSTGAIWDLRFRAFGAMVALLSAAEFAYEAGKNSPFTWALRSPTFKELFACGSFVAAILALMSILFLAHC